MSMPLFFLSFLDMKNCPLRKWAMFRGTSLWAEQMGSASTSVHPVGYLIASCCCLERLLLIFDFDFDKI